MRQNPFWFDFKLLLVTFYLWNVSCSAQQYVGDVCLVARTGYYIVLICLPFSYYLITILLLFNK